jgi:hypothetical protein
VAPKLRLSLLNLLLFLEIVKEDQGRRKGKERKRRRAGKEEECAGGDIGRTVSRGVPQSPVG